MAENVIKHDDLFEDDILKSTIDQFNELNRVLAETEAGLKAIAGVLAKKVRAGVDPKSLAEIEQLKVLLEKLKSTEAGMNEVKRAQVQLREAEKKQITEIRDQYKAQDGILGNLLIKQKELKRGLLTATTKEQIKDINQELFRTTKQIQNIKEGGTSGFNSWGNALTSFQFKFNALGASIGQLVAGGLTGLVTTAADFGMKVVAGAGEWAKSMGFFGDSVRVAKENTESLNENLKKFQGYIDAIGKSGEVQFSAAFSSKIDDVNLRIAKQIELVQKLSDESAKASKGLKGEDREKILAPFRAEEAKLLQLQLERIRITEENERESIKRKVEAARNGTKAQVEELKVQLGQQKANIGNLERDEFESLDDFNLRKKERFRLYQQEIAELNKEFSAKDDAERKKKDDKVIDSTIKVQKKIAEIKNTDFSVKQKDPFGNPISPLTQTKEQFEKEEQEKIDVQIRAFNERRAIEDAFIKYEIDALSGKFGKEEQIIAKQEIATKIALGTATADEIREFNDQINKEKEDQAKADEKRLEDRISLAEKFNDAIAKGIEERTAKELKINADKLTEIDRQIAVQQELALKGETNTFDALQKKRAENIAEQKLIEDRAAKAKEAQQLAELFLEFMKVYAKDGFAGAAKATAATIAAKGLSSLIAGNFAEGVENFKGKGTGTSDSNLIGFSSGESVVTAQGTRETPGLVTAINENGLMGVQDWIMKNPYAGTNADKSRETQLTESLAKMLHDQMKGLRKDIKGLPDVEFKRNILGELVRIETDRGVTNEITMKNAPIIYRKN